MWRQMIPMLIMRIKSIKNKNPSYLPQIDQISRSPAVAGNGDVVGLGVQGEQLHVHRAGQGQGDLEQKHS